MQLKSCHFYKENNEGRTVEAKNILEEGSPAEILKWLIGLSFNDMFYVPNRGMKREFLAVRRDMGLFQGNGVPLEIVREWA